MSKPKQEPATELLQEAEAQEAMKRKKVLTYMGFARKSGNLVGGTGTCIATMKKGSVRLMIIADDISENSEKKIMKEIRKSGVPYIKYGKGEELSHAAGMSGRSTFAITDEGFAETIAKAIADAEAAADAKTIADAKAFAEHTSQKID